MFEKDISPYNYFSHCRLRLTGQATILLSTAHSFGMLHLSGSIMNNITKRKTRKYIGIIDVYNIDD